MSSVSPVLIAMPAMLFPMAAAVPVMVPVVRAWGVIGVWVGISRGRIIAVRGVRILAVNSTIGAAVTALDRTPAAKKEKNQTEEPDHQLHNPKPPAKKLARGGRPGLWG
jgi:hypothetical protein